MLHAQVGSDASSSGILGENILLAFVHANTHSTRCNL